MLNGLTSSIDAYGAGPFDDVAYGGRAGVPMCEFWSGVPAWGDFLMGWCKAMAAGGATTGRQIDGDDLYFVAGAVPEVRSSLPQRN